MTNEAAGQPMDRPLDALLARYASGQLSAPLTILVEGHLALTPRSRAFVRALEALHGAELEAIPPVALDDRDAALAAILASRGPVESAAAASTTPSLLPAPIRRFLKTDLEEIRWRRILPGVEECKIQETGGWEAVLYRVEPGGVLPSHSHEGSEYTLVLKGGFSDVTGHFQRGEVAVADQDIEHCPVADEGEECICLVVTDAPLRFSDPAGGCGQPPSS